MALILKIMTRENIISLVLSEMISEIRKQRLTVCDAYRLTDKYANKIDKLYNSDKKKICPNCGLEFNGIECNKCGFDASEIDIF